MIWLNGRKSTIVIISAKQGMNKRYKQYMANNLKINRKDYQHYSLDLYENSWLCDLKYLVVCLLVKANHFTDLANTNFFLQYLNSYDIL